MRRNIKKLLILEQDSKIKLLENQLQTPNSPIPTVTPQALVHEGTLTDTDHATHCYLQQDENENQESNPISSQQHDQLEDDEIDVQDQSPPTKRSKRFQSRSNISSTKGSSSMLAMTRPHPTRRLTRSSVTSSRKKYFMSKVSL